MSSGQAAWDDERDEVAHREHTERLRALGPDKILTIVDKIHEHLQYLEAASPALPRSGWYRLDEMRKELSKLR